MGDGYPPEECETYQHEWINAGGSFSDITCTEGSASVHSSASIQSPEPVRSLMSGPDLKYTKTWLMQ